MNDDLESWYWNSQRNRSWTDDVQDEDELEWWAMLTRKTLCRWMTENPY